MMLRNSAFLSLEGAEYIRKTTRIEGDFAYIESDFVRDGAILTSNDTDEPGYVWRNGGWQGYMSEVALAEEAPCALNFDE